MVYGGIQNLEPGSARLERPRRKLAKVVECRYMELELVLSMICFFAVPKWEGNNRMVYGASVSGINDII